MYKSHNISLSNFELLPLIGRSVCCTGVSVAGSGAVVSVAAGPPPGGAPVAPVAAAGDAGAGPPPGDAAGDAAAAAEDHGDHDHAGDDHDHAGGDQE